jgi:4-carboxymuconolactone decarboxylase
MVSGETHYPISNAIRAHPKMTDSSSSEPPSRFPSGAHSEEQKAAFAAAEEAVAETFASAYLNLKDTAGNLLGPFPVLSYTPRTFLPYLRHVNEVNISPLITAKERELAILATCSVTGSDYIIYAHKVVGKSLGLSQEQVDWAAMGRCPNGLELRDRTVFEIGLKLATSWGRLEDDLFDGAVKVLGRDGVSALSQIVGAYAMNSVIVNVADLAVSTA